MASPAAAASSGDASQPEHALLQHARLTIGTQHCMIWVFSILGTPTNNQRPVRCPCAATKGSGHMPNYIRVPARTVSVDPPTFEHCLQLVYKTADDSVAVVAAVARPETRVVVDHYECSTNGDYTLSMPSTDLLTYLTAISPQVSIVPSLVLAAAQTAKLQSGVQSTNEVLMVAPTAFGFNKQTAADNHFMHAGEEGEGETLMRQVAHEFAGLHDTLTERHGALLATDVRLFQSTRSACKPVIVRHDCA